MRELKKCIDVSLASLNFAQRVSIAALFKRQGSHFASARKRWSRALARAFFKELESETRVKTSRQFHERSPVDPGTHVQRLHIRRRLARGHASQRSYK